MKITYKTKKLEKICTDYSKATSECGTQIAKKLYIRLVELESAQSLQDIKMINSARLHPLSGKREGEYAVDLTGNYRLILIASNGEIKLERIDEVRLEEIVDYH